MLILKYSEHNIFYLREVWSLLNGFPTISFFISFSRERFFFLFY